MKRPPFSGRALVLLVACAVALFALSVLLHAYDDSPTATGGRARPGSYSTSAIGYAGLFETLHRLDYPVTRSVGHTLALVGMHGTLILAEPDLHRLGREETYSLMAAPRILLILPKWRGKTDPVRPAWISQADLMGPGPARQVLGLATARADVFHAEAPKENPHNALGVEPEWPDVLQLVRSDRIRPIVGNQNGMLVGEFLSDRGKIWILSDPDIASNHGILRGNNAAFMAALLDTLRMQDTSATDARIVFDETTHGFEAAQGTPVKLLFRFPFVAVTGLLCATAVLLVLAGGGRFGPARRAGRDTTFSKQGLIENGARLLDYAGHHASVLQRYVSMTIRTTAASLHAPSGLDETGLMAWLDRIGEARNVTRSCVSIAREAAGIAPKNVHKLSRLLECARDIHVWKGEMLDGPAPNRNNRHQDPR